MAEAQRTKLASRFLFKTAFFVVLFGLLGVWGFYDAMIKYPQRGVRFAEYQKYQYLSRSEESVTIGQASVEDPITEFARLKKQRPALIKAVQEAGSNPPGKPVAELARLEWLEALDRVGLLTPEQTRIEDPRAELADLTKKWSTESPPTGLAAYDLPSQWIIGFVGIGGAMWAFFLFARAAAKKYAWDPDQQRLTMPGGHAIEPGDLAEIDKSEWHKFIVHFKIKDSHAELGGKTLRLDLYRYDPLESWVLEMERTAFPEHAAAAPTPDDRQTPSSDTPDEPTGSVA